MTIARSPHPVFAALWVVWFANVLGALGFSHPTYGLVVLLAFLPIEGAAVLLDTRSRDTLSEIATWTIRRVSKHERTGRGWNALLLLVVLCITYLLARTFWAYSGSVVLAGGVFVLATVWLHDHWLSPQVHG
ncbi:MAG: hypothetical protein ABL993_02595 [Vicinamibacterales bacterium]